MKQLTDTYKTTNQGIPMGNAWLQLIRWLRLLIISLTRISEGNIRPAGTG